MDSADGQTDSSRGGGDKGRGRDRLEDCETDRQTQPAADDEALIKIIFLQECVAVCVCGSVCMCECLCLCVCVL